MLVGESKCIIYIISIYTNLSILIILEYTNDSCRIVTLDPGNFIIFSGEFLYLEYLTDVYYLLMVEIKRLSDY
jgi:hypothetical protein